MRERQAGIQKVIVRDVLLGDIVGRDPPSLRDREGLLLCSREVETEVLEAIGMDVTSSRWKQ